MAVPIIKGLENHIYSHVYGVQQEQQRHPRNFIYVQGKSGRKPMIVYLQSAAGSRLSNSTTANLHSLNRYSVRAEGDMVRDHDRIILESCRFKGLQLCLDAGSAAGENKSAMGDDEIEGQDGVVSVSDDAYYRSGTYACIQSFVRLVISDR